MVDAQEVFNKAGPLYQARMWRPHLVGRLRPRGGLEEQPAELQIVSEKWNTRAQVPYLAYLPERDRLLMLLQCEHQPASIYSDDHGATWTRPRLANPELAVTPDRYYLGVGLSYLGNGTAVFSDARGSCEATRLWFTHDHGESWPESKPMPRAFDGKYCLQWDPFLVDRNRTTGSVERLALAGYTCTTDGNHTLGFIRFSSDLGDTWTPDLVVPQWSRKNEIALTRTASGDILAAARLDPADENLDKIDHYTGFGISVSKDDGRTWSAVETVYEMGRHHTSTIVLPSGHLVMTYVVRAGYPETKEGHAQFGVEAIVSRDHGRTWDLDGRTVLHAWNSGRTDIPQWHRSVQQTSSVLLPDGHIYTAFGTYYRSEPAEGGAIRPLDVGLVRWTP